MPSVEILTFTEWMAKYRPDGKGRITVGGFDPIEFTEVICDLCNAEISPKDRDGNETIMHVKGSYTLCPKCAKA